jgi:hypothetical protein
MSTTPPPEWRSYEELTEQLIQRIGAADGIATRRLERDALMAGRANPNQIDVVWEFEDASGQAVRLLFECRSYQRRINQQAVHSWRGAVDDVAFDGVETVGVMVTSTGYQGGARRVADTYGIVICELRGPTAEDLANRITSVKVDLLIRSPYVTELSVKATEQLGPRRQSERTARRVLPRPGGGGDRAIGGQPSARRTRSRRRRPTA